MSVRRTIGNVILWVAGVPMLLLVGVLAFGQQNDEVAADSVTTGRVVEHQRNPNSSTGLCDFTYRVDDRRHRAQDNCDQDENPIGATVTVNYVEDDPGAGFLHGDKTWWDKLETVVKAGGVIVGIWVLVLLWWWKSGRAGIRDVVPAWRRPRQEGDGPAGHGA